MYGMGILGWIILGALAGWIASMLTRNNANMGAFLNIVVGILGAFIGGLLFNLLGGYGVTGFNLWSLLVAVAGATLLLAVINLIKRRK